MPNQPRKSNPARAVRVEAALWAAAKARAEERGETVSDVIRRALYAYIMGWDLPRAERLRRAMATDAPPIERPDG